MCSGHQAWVLPAVSELSPKSWHTLLSPFFPLELSFNYFLYHLMTEAVWRSMSPMGTFPANKAGPGQMCLPDSIIKDEGTNTQQPAMELHIVCRHLQHLMLYRKAEACHLLFRTHSTRTDGTSGNTWLPRQCRKSPQPRNPKGTRIQRFKEKAGGRWMLQVMHTSLPQLTEDMASVSKVQMGPRSAIISHIPSCTHKGCRASSNTLFNYRYGNK